jgi:photosystem II stability/assembly factor-like uncharacterized protein
MNRNYLILFVFLFTINIYSQVDWVKLNSPTLLNLEKIFCIDSLNCWAAGDSGIIIHTIDGGLNWSIQHSGITTKIQDIFFINNNLGWAVSARLDSIFESYILSTTNGGLSWQKKIFEIENKTFHTVYFLDSLNGWIAGGPSQAFFGTSDGGSTWFQPNFKGDYSDLPVLKIIFFSKEFGIACGGKHDLIGVIWKTIDGGSTWLSKPMGLEPLRDLYFVDSLNIMGVGGDFEYGTGIAYSSDGGNTWDYRLPGFLGTATGLSFRKKNEAWACLPAEKKMIISMDSGKSWELYNTHNATIKDLTFTDSLHGFAVGDSGVILKYSDDVVFTENENLTNSPTSFFLYQNFPNPFNPGTSIQYAIDSKQFVQLKVYDILGRAVATLVNQEQNAGRYKVNFNASFLSSGVYFYQLRVGDPTSNSPEEQAAQSFIETKNMILLK